MKYHNPSLLDWITLGAVAAAACFAFVTARTCYRVQTSPTDLPLEGYRHVRSGIASWYKASGMVAASRIYPLGSRVRVRHCGMTVDVLITSRGPAWKWFLRGRMIDLSREAFARIAAPRFGLIAVETELVPPAP